MLDSILPKSSRMIGRTQLIKHGIDVGQTDKTEVLSRVAKNSGEDVPTSRRVTCCGEEDKHRAKTENTVNINEQRILINMEFDDEDEDVPSSITILLKAHEFLGRHGWCCINEGQLLIFIMKLLIPQFRSPLYLAIKEKLREPLEQIKHYDEHVKSHAKLTWEACELLFEFYRPEILPSFESKRVDSINADVAHLFKQMCKLVPQDSNPNQILDELNAYLVGKRPDFPCIRNRLHNSQIGYIYYLIADYYFKAVPHQSWKKAITYYKFDLCLHPNELNSWAGLAMSTSTLMETWLNNFQPNINEERYLKEAKIAQRSYEQAINLAPSHLTIWTEFGNFLYTVHSFCSRLLKQESDSLSMERFRTIESHKEEMLEEAEKCFTSANRIYTACQGIDEPQDERWLYHYMLAKISEKKNHEPLIFLSHYSKIEESEIQGIGKLSVQPLLPQGDFTANFTGL
ncbi:hypothetical protein TSAR_005095 [Trichomalopsis sarcophagae]|uniref:KIF-binding protein n=1 Tax=Trichomalopsis sarcophagae TaxID=543379 RepID=A0A232FLF4_9HYME|nr:hypothetical protein TSAR_005095 [Trichomalopsis sarcophagae]